MQRAVGWASKVSSDFRRNEGAQNQHYVSKFILRNFLINEDKEQVAVFCKSNGRGFVTSIRNIMAERRFHDFAIGDRYVASFENAICRIEDRLLPTYQRVVEERRLDRSVEERANLAMFIAFQFVRTRKTRDLFVQLEQQIKDHLEKQGCTIDQVEGYEPMTENRLTQHHIEFIRSAIPEFAQHIAAKDFLLMSAPEGRAFYLADNPVCLHNNETAHTLFSNNGIAVRGIEVYLPLTANLMLAVWCPSILEQVRAERDRQDKEHKSKLLGMLMQGHITLGQMQHQLSALNDLDRPVKDLLTSFEAGTPVFTDESNMDFSNALQMHNARDYVICKQGDFELARKFVNRSRRHSGKQPTAV